MSIENDLFDAFSVSKKPAVNKLPVNPEVGCNTSGNTRGRFPSWLHRKLPQGGQLSHTGSLLQKYGLNTVCEEAKCPNRLECYSKKTATFLALGKECTRNCGFCDIDFAKTPKAPESDEPERIALSALELGLKHVVVTMVARDDLPDGGAEHIALIIRKVKELSPETTIEVLTSDFSGNLEALNLVLSAQPEIFNHNIETTKQLTPRVRHKATYERTLEVLKYAKEHGKGSFVKSGIMVGLGETVEEVKDTIKDLCEAGCDIVTIGQYLQADKKKLLVKAFITPEIFKEYEEYGYSLGIKHMYCGPFVRSSYNAQEIQKILTRK
ncbi:MAG: lipoyl synthase [Chlamydiae bacterium]|nr:lipoyl synthase [Chlamydiota bacterium]